MFAQLLAQLTDDYNPETVAFGQYFTTHYNSRPKTWTYSYRIDSDINANMHIENFHKIINDIYMEGKKTK